MNETKHYNGTGKLAEAIAQLYGFSPKNQARVAKLTQQGKDALGIASKAKVLPTDTKQAIWQWHYDRLHSTGEAVEIISQPDNNKPVEIITQPDDSKAVKIIAQLDNNTPVGIISQLSDFDIIRVAFYITRDGKRIRQVIGLDGAYINTLGITRQAVPKWIQSAIDSSMAFDANLPITRQVKVLMLRAIRQALDDARRA